MIENGANINDRDCHGYTALMTAIYLDKINAATVLIEMGADLNLKDKDGKNVLKGKPYNVRKPVLNAVKLRKVKERDNNPSLINRIRGMFE